MIDYNPALKEIKAAKRSLALLESAGNLDDMEQCWRDCINHIEKSHTKLLSATNTVKSKFSSVFCKELILKKSDPLLSYINQARNTDNHSISNITNNIHGGMSINPPKGSNYLYIERLEINNSAMSYRGSPAEFAFHNPSIETIPVTNYGKTYNPPKSHLGSKLLSTKPAKLAELAITFHEKWIEESKVRFP